MPCAESDYAEATSAAIRFIRAHAAEYGIDPYRIGVYGNSAGGHLAAVAGTSADVPELERTIGGNLAYSSRASAVVDFFGPTDILHEALDITIPPFSSGDAADTDGPNTYTGMLIGHLPGMQDLRDNLANSNPPYPQKALLVSQTNPMTFLDPTDPPFYIAHGTSDNIVPIKQSQRLYNALVAADVPATYRIVSGGTHGNLGSSAEQAAGRIVDEKDRLVGGTTFAQAKVPVAMVQGPAVVGPAVGAGMCDGLTSKLYASCTSMRALPDMQIDWPSARRHRAGRDD